MIIKSTGEKDNDSFEINTDERYVEMTLVFPDKDPNTVVLWRSADSEQVTAAEWTKSVLNNDNDVGLEDLIAFLEDNEFIIDWKRKPQLLAYDKIKFYIKTFKGIPKDMVQDWLVSELDLRLYKNKYRGKILSNKFGF